MIDAAYRDHRPLSEMDTQVQDNCETSIVIPA